MKYDLGKPPDETFSIDVVESSGGGEVRPSLPAPSTNSEMGALSPEVELANTVFDSDQVTKMSSDVCCMFPTKTICLTKWMFVCSDINT